MSELKHYDVQQSIAKATSEKKKNKALFSKLKQLKTKDLDEKFHIPHDNVFENYNCLSCANCCKTTSPIFTRKDVDRLAAYLDMKPVEFQIKYLIIDEDDDFVLHSSPCPFLEEDNTCKVYSARPNACREYPHTNRKKMYQILDLTLQNTLVCPAVNLIVEKIKKGLQNQAN